MIDDNAAAATSAESQAQEYELRDQSKPQDAASSHNEDSTMARADQQTATSSAASQCSSSFMSFRTSNGEPTTTASNTQETDMTAPTQAKSGPKKRRSKRRKRDASNRALLRRNLAARTSPPKRSISRSMLELDTSVCCDKFEVVWRDLSYTYKAGYFSRKPVAPVLSNLSGSFASNQLVALIGPSGSGKTTFLQCLAANDKSYSGALRIVGLEELKVALIGQHDCLLPGLTAKETLIYASRLQNSNPDFDHETHCLSVLEQLGIGDCADKDVAKLSGGQAKRVTIAKDILYPTNLLVLDEVTSGLDASTSFAIIRLLKRLVSDLNYPMTIVLSIHQPSARLFSLFDRVFVMSAGACIYAGSCDIDTVNDELSKFGLECPKFHNIADYLIEIASEDSPANFSVRAQLSSYQAKLSTLRFDSCNASLSSAGSSVSCLAKNDFTSALEMNENDNHQSALHSDTDNENDDQVAILLHSDLFEAVERARRRRKRSLIRQTITHYQRSQLRIKRSYILTYLQVTTYIVLGLQLATFYGKDIGEMSGCPRQPVSLVSFLWSAEKEIQDARSELRRVQENLNFLLVAVMTTTFAALEITVLTFPMEAKTVKREWRNGWYKTSSYFLGRTLADLPFQVVFVIIFSAIVYTLTGQVGFPGWRFSSFTAVLIMTALIAQTVGFIFGAIFMDNLSAAVFTAPLCIFPALLFSGFFSRVSNVPLVYKPLTYLSHFRYAFDSILITLYGYNRCECDNELLRLHRESKSNQSAAIRDIFQSLFGSVSCDLSDEMTAPSLTPTLEGGISALSGSDDGGSLVADLPRDSKLLSLLNETVATTRRPLLASGAFAESIIESIGKLELSTLASGLSLNASTGGAWHVASNATGGDESSQGVLAPMPVPPLATRAAESGGGGQNLLVDQFTAKMTTLLNSQSNYGHVLPTDCNDYNPYLINEFNLHKSDLIFGLSMMLAIFIVMRVLCNIILASTISGKG